MEVVRVNITPRLTEILNERGITQTKLSEMSGVPQGSISRFDKNSRHEDAHLFAIARALGLSVEDLFHVSEE
ncbi:helix-turn-helix transcriptional regulator [Paenibacillus alvei]|uniref:Helix-turn-helix transcriptional regulator n=1 Tax=Paenibacillus alvei TaxID=44250 RepID=A0AAP7A6P9_PAEAL|nr:helix-turn-helix transcriptional regulator [Paenibacillus alvei]NOJ73577.1 helix-turn-helix transcriptional regulator [Paenibacillus alvei]